MKTDTANEYHQQATAFLTKHGLTFTATLKDSKPAPWGDADGTYRPHYRVTISRTTPQWRGGAPDNFQPKRLVFDFWASIRDGETGKAPTAYDVLACISSDIHTPETFEDFCAEYGENEDSRKALQTFRRADRFAKRLREFFTEAEAAELQEIQ